MSMLKFNDKVTDTFDQKVEMLKGLFFLASSSVDLSDIKGFFYSTSPYCSIIIIKSKVSSTLNRFKSDKTSSSDGIFNKIFKVCSEKFVELLTFLFQACVTYSYHSRIFKVTNRITLKKSDKEDYTKSKACRSIALLNTLSKVIKFIIESKIIYLAKTHRLLLDAQMRARKNSS